MGILKSILVLSLFLSLNLMATVLEKEHFEDLKTIHLKNDLSSQKKLLYFWASWCPNCKESLKTKLPQLQNAKVDVVTVNVDDDEKRGKHFIDEEELNFPVIRDEQKKLRKLLNVFAVPSWAVIEKKDGKWVATSFATGTDFAQMKSALALHE